jgi:hypothetical protein
MELHKQTGLSANCEVRTFCRVADRTSDNALLEDKVFAVVVARDIKGTLDTPWGGGKNAWLTLAELTRQKKYFPNTLDIIDLIESDQAYASFIGNYDMGDY